MKERIKTYLANGLKPSEVATILGCSPAYISQLLKNDEFKTEVEALMLDSASSVDEKLEAKYEGLEHTILQQMQSAVVGAELPHLSKALEAVTKARDMKDKRRNPALLGAGNTLIQQVVNISVPAHAMQAPHFQLNEKSEVIAIDDRPMASMTSEGVKNLFGQLGAKHANTAIERDSNPQQITSYPAPTARAA